MATLVYENFDLKLQRSEGGYRAEAVSRAGQVVSSFPQPFSSLELENFLLRVGRQRSGRRSVNSPEHEAARTFGGRLFDSVFTGKLGASLDASMRDADREGHGLRIQLHLTDAPELIDVPWEFLYNPRLRRFIALSDETPIVRHLDLPEDVRPLNVKPPLKILVAISSPTNYPRLDVDREWRRLREALDDLARRSLVDIDRLDNVTATALQRRLRRGAYHVFHFVGHGAFDRNTQDGTLIFEDDDRLGRPLSGRDLGVFLHDHRSMRLAVLNACEGARSSVTDLFAGTAQSLMQQRVPAVIAMQFEITDEAAVTFAREFYGAVADGYPVDAALSEARKAIYAADNGLEWATPVLYLRAPEARIFEIEPPTPVTAPEPAPVTSPAALPMSAPSRSQPRKRDFAMLAALMPLTNVNFGVTPSFRIDLSVIAPLLIMLVVRHFGKWRAALLGVLTVVPWMFVALVQSPDEVPAAIRSAYGPLAVPHHAFDHLVRLVLLGYLTGWLVDRIRDTLISAGLTPSSSSGLRLPRALWVVPAACAILALDLVFVVNSNGIPVAFPTRNLALLGCVAAAVWLGPRNGGLATALALTAAVVLQPFSGLIGGGFRFDFMAIGQVVSVTMLAIYAGRVGLTVRTTPNLVGRWAEKLALVSRSSVERDGWLWVFVPLMVVFSAFIRFEVTGFKLSFNLQPFLIATVILMGAYCGARHAAIAVGVIETLQVLAAPVLFSNGLILSVLGLTVNTALGSAVNVVVLTAAAWAAGRIELEDSRRNCYVLAIGIFVAYEVAMLVKTGTFLFPFIGLEVNGANLGLLTGVARLLEPWLIVVLVRAGLRAP